MVIIPNTITTQGTRFNFCIFGITYRVALPSNYLQIDNSMSIDQSVHHNRFHILQPVGCLIGYMEGRSL